MQMSEESGNIPFSQIQMLSQKFNRQKEKMIIFSL